VQDTIAYGGGSVSLVKLTYIIWKDSHYSAGPLYDTDEGARQPVELQTAGLLIHRNRKGDTIAMDRFTGEEEQTVRHVSFMPKGMIVQTVTIELDLERRKAKVHWPKKTRPAKVHPARHHAKCSH